MDWGLIRTLQWGTEARNSPKSIVVLRDPAPGTKEYSPLGFCPGLSRLGVVASAPGPTFRKDAEKL